MKSPVIIRLLARYSKKLAKNQALQAEIENVYQKLMAFSDGTNTEVLKLLCRLEKRLLKIKEQNQNIQAIIEVFEKPANISVKLEGVSLPEVEPGASLIDTPTRLSMVIPFSEDDLTLSTSNPETNRPTNLPLVSVQ